MRTPSMWVTGLIVLVLAAMNVQRDVPLRLNDQMMNLAAAEAARIWYVRAVR